MSEDSKITRLPNNSNNLLASIDRNAFIELVNGLMRGAVRLDNSLTSMEMILSDPVLFENLSEDQKIKMYQVLSQRHNSVVSSVNKVFDVAVKNDFNRIFFGLSNEDEDNSEEELDTEENKGLTKEAALVLSKLNNAIQDLQNSNAKQK